MLFKLDHALYVILVNKYTEIYGNFYLDLNDEDSGLAAYDLVTERS
jgi:hypothetical protein